MKTMAMFIDGRATDRDSLRTALAFCRFLDGRLDVICAPQDPTVIASDSQVFVVENDDAATRTAARAAYDEVCGKLQYCTWRTTDEPKTRAIASQGLQSDVTILERTSKEAGPDAAALNTALFETPGPVLVTPPQARSTVGESVAVAWSPSIQSTRALRSALPILAKAKSVTVIVNGADHRMGTSALAGYLNVHGLKPAFHSFDGAKLTARGRGRAVLAAVDALGADLLVMGAFGENKVTALMGLGRATRKIVSDTKIPVLVQR